MPSFHLIGDKCWCWKYVFCWKIYTKLFPLLDDCLAPLMAEAVRNRSIALLPRITANDGAVDTSSQRGLWPPPISRLCRKTYIKYACALLDWASVSEFNFFPQRSFYVYAQPITADRFYLLFFRITSLAPGQSHEFPNDNKASLKNIGKLISLRD